MNYEEKYKQALERARQFSEHPLLEDSATIAEYIFPELAECEDERIKEEIVAYINELADLKNDKIPTKWLTWLEKQGEKDPCIGCTNDKGCVTCENGNLKEIKVEQKFHVGDWIGGYYTNYKVLSVHNEGYLVEDTDGNKINILFENEKFHHLFTIADAKDGDVLVTTSLRNCCPFIYRMTDRNNNLAYYYAGIDGNGDFCEGCIKRTLCHFGSLSNVVPATKKQCDLLFQKMKDAGYEWDAEKKELKKMEVVSKESEDGKNKRVSKEITQFLKQKNGWNREWIAWLEKQGKKLNADEVIAWLVANICDYEYYVEWFKKEFKL